GTFLSHLPAQPTSRSMGWITVCPGENRRIPDSAAAAPEPLRAFDGVPSRFFPELPCRLSPGVARVASVDPTLPEIHPPRDRTCRGMSHVSVDVGSVPAIHRLSLAVTCPRTAASLPASESRRRQASLKPQVHS